MTNREMVAEFMRRIGAETPDKPSEPDAVLAGLRMGLILEELSEAHSAMRDGNMVGALDGLADLKYVVVGAAVACGAPLDDFYFAPAASRRPPDARDAAALLAGVLPPLVRVAAAMAGDAELEPAVAALDVAVSMEAAMLGLPLKEAFAEVHRSNMTKNAGYRIGASKYGAGGGKGPGWSAPDLSGVLAAAGWGDGMKTVKQTLQFIVEGGSVVRYHTRPGIKPDTNAHHSHGVAMLCALLWGAPERTPPARLLMAALAHDLAEQRTSDVSRPSKEAMPDRGAALGELERATLAEYGLDWTSRLDGTERTVLELADLMDCLLYACRELALGNRGALLVWRRMCAAAESFSVGREVPVDVALRAAALYDAAREVYHETVGPSGPDFDVFA